MSQSNFNHNGFWKMVLDSYYSKTIKIEKPTPLYLINCEECENQFKVSYKPRVCKCYECMSKSYSYFNINEDENYKPIIQISGRYPNGTYKPKLNKKQLDSILNED